MASKKRKLEQLSPSPKRLKTNDTINVYTCSIKIAKDATILNAKIFLNNRTSIPEKIHQYLANSNVQLKLHDFASRDILYLFTNETSSDLKNFTCPEFKITSDNSCTLVILAYLKGLISRKDEIGIIPLEDCKYQLLIFDKDTTSNNDSFDPSLYALLVPKFNFVFDLDETLVRSRIPELENYVPKIQKGEYEINLEGQKFIVAVRPGSETLLKWACQLFNVYIFTNSVYPYAKQIVMTLDPQRHHLLKNVDVQDDSQIQQFVKSREDMIKQLNLPDELRMKCLKKFNLDIFRTVVLDDDPKIWEQQQNLLDFDELAENRTRHKFFYAVRTATWEKLRELAMIHHTCKLKLEGLKKQKSMKAELKKLKKVTEITYSQDQILPSL